MRHDPTPQNFVETYQWLVSLVNPRPIAWVSTLSPGGVANLAPFSFFNVFSANPPVVVFSPTLRRNGSKKDTLINIEASGEFVVHISTEPQVQPLNQSAAEIPADQSEFTLTGLETIACERVRPPRIASAPAALECKLRQIVPLGDGPIAGNLVIGEVLMIHIADTVLDEKGKVDPKKLQTIGRMGGDFYARTQDLFALARPS